MSIRSALYVPCDHSRAIEKTKQLDADCYIFDLEDGVAPERKAEARNTIRQSALPDGLCLLRINHCTTSDYHEDMALLASLPVDGLMLSKVHDTHDIENAIEHLTNIERTDISIWCNIETPHGVLHANEICAHPLVSGIVAGTNDLSNDLNIRYTPQRHGLMHSLACIQLAARAYHKIVLDGTYVQLDNDAGLTAECEQGRMLGFDGKTLIHPKQIERANRAFSPTPDEITEAHEIITVYEAAMNENKAVALLNGRMIEALHYRRAKQIVGASPII